MATVTEIPDLWGDDIKVDVLSPLAILKVQGELLGTKTKGLLAGLTTSGLAGAKQEREEIHQFDLHSPAVNYTENVLTVRHKQGRPYPVDLRLQTAIDWPKQLWEASGSEYSEDGTSSDCRCGNEKEFLLALRAALQSPPVRSAIDSILAMSNERNMAPPASAG